MTASSPVIPSHRHLVGVALGLLLAMVVLRGDFCSDVLGFPVLVESAQSVDLQVNLKCFAGPQAPGCSQGTSRRMSSTPVVSMAVVVEQPGSPAIPLAGLPDTDSEIDFEILDGTELPPDVGAGDVDLLEMLSEYELDLDEALADAAVPTCATLEAQDDGDPQEVGVNCLCRRPPTAGEAVERMIVRKGCLLGQIGVDLPNLNSSVRNVARYIDGIYIRDIQSGAYAREMATDVPPLRFEMVGIAPLEEGVSVSDTFESPAGSARADLGATAAVAAGTSATNAQLLHTADPRHPNRCNDIPNLPNDATERQRLNAALAPLDAIVFGDRRCDDATLPCGLRCAGIAADRMALRADQLDTAGIILKNLRFGVRARLARDMDVTALAGPIFHDPQVPLHIHARLRFEIVLVVVPN